jgi:hypothetical protein
MDKRRQCNKCKCDICKINYNTLSIKIDNQRDVTTICERCLVRQYPERIKVFSTDDEREFCGILFKFGDLFYLWDENFDYNLIKFIHQKFVSSNDDDHNNFIFLRSYYLNNSQQKLFERLLKHQDKDDDNVNKIKIQNTIKEKWHTFKGGPKGTAKTLVNFLQQLNNGIKGIIVECEYPEDHEIFFPNTEQKANYYDENNYSADDLLEKKRKPLAILSSVYVPITIDSTIESELEAIEELERQINLKNQKIIMLRKDDLIMNALGSTTDIDFQSCILICEYLSKHFNDLKRINQTFFINNAKNSFLKR